MYFTKTDLKQIEDYINRNSIKDSEFPDANELQGSEIVSILQNGVNKKIRVNDLADSVSEILSQDYINVTHNYLNDQASTLEDAVISIPVTKRSTGLLITYLDKDDKEWKLYQFTGSSTQSGNLTLWENIIDKITKTINFKPDDEDLKVNDGKIHLANRKQNNLGKGYVIFRNTVLPDNNSISSLVQDDFTQEDTIYIIRYNFDLGGKEINIPANSILQFEGGSITNGTIVGNNTEIKSGIYNILPNITFKGTFIIDRIYTEWFGADSIYAKTLGDTDALESILYTPTEEINNLQDSSVAINTALILSNISTGEVYLLGSVYKITNTINIPEKTTLHTTPSTIIFSYINGTGLSVVTEDTAVASTTFTKETKTEAPYALAMNQYFSADSMGIAINMYPVQTSIVGGGSLSLAKSTYTIGIYINGTGYRTMDTAYLSPVIDLQITGGIPGFTIPDTNSIVITDGNYTAADISSLPDVGGTIWDKPTGNIWAVDKNGTDINSKYHKSPQKVQSQYNTSIRLEIVNGYNSSRVFGSRITLRDAWGFRGLEVIIRNTGWSNHVKWTGSISYKQGGYINIFNENSFSAQDFSEVFCQLENYTGGYDTRFFYAHRAYDVKLPYVYDYTWIKPFRMQNGWYLGTDTSYISMIQDSTYYGIEDFGKANIVNTNNPEIYNTQDVTKLYYIDALKYRGIIPVGDKRRAYMSTITTPQQLLTVQQFSNYIKSNPLKYDESLGVYNQINTELRNCFDADYTTTYLAIDSDNDKYGFIVSLDNYQSKVWNSLLKGSMKYVYVTVQYYTEDKTYIDKPPIMSIIQTSESFSQPSVINKTMRFRRIEEGYNSATTTLCTIPLIAKNGQAQFPYLCINLENPIPGYKLYVVRISMWINGVSIDNTYNTTHYWPISSYKYGATNNRPMCVQPGFVYYDTTLNTPVLWNGTDWINISNTQE